MKLELLIVSQEGVTWDDWCALADACERSAVPTLFAGDHYISTNDELGKVAHDAWTIITGLAARTSVLRLGTMVTPVTFRPPAVLANAVATADHVSGGRVELGLGSGWMEREHQAFGFPFPRPRVRQQMLAEQLEIVHRLGPRNGSRSTAATTRSKTRPAGRGRCNLPIPRSSSVAAARRARRCRPRASPTRTTSHGSRILRNSPTFANASLKRAARSAVIRRRCASRSPSTASSGDP